MPGDWIDIGDAQDLAQKPLHRIAVEGLDLVLTFADGVFTALFGRGNHVGGPLAEGRLEGENVVCPWHRWHFDRKTGVSPYGEHAGRVAVYDVRVDGGRVLVRREPALSHIPKSVEPDPLARSPRRAPGPIRVLGLSTTARNRVNPRFSASEFVLSEAIAAVDSDGCETQLLRLNDIDFGSCRGYYSIAAEACTWPCTLTQFDKTDGLRPVYEAIVHWADVVLVATPIRWGRASALYYKMVERLNAVQNQSLTHGAELILRHKTAAHIIIGGQDNIQSVAGDLLAFWGEIGFNHPPAPYIGHSRGWTAEDMENNVRDVAQSRALAEASAALARRAVALSAQLLR